MAKLIVDVDDKDRDVSIIEVDSLDETMAVVVLIRLVPCSDVSSTSIIVEGKLYSHMGPP